MTTDDRLHTFLHHVDETFSCITIKLSQFQIWSSCVLKQPYSAIVNWEFPANGRRYGFRPAGCFNRRQKLCGEKKPKRCSKPCFHYLLGRDAMQPPCRAEVVNSPHRWAAGSESYPGPCSWRPSRAGTATGSGLESGVERRKSRGRVPWKNNRCQEKKKIFSLTCLILWEIKYLACVLFIWFMLNYNCNKTWIMGIISWWIKYSSPLTCCV